MLWRDVSPGCHHLDMVLAFTPIVPTERITPFATVASYEIPRWGMV